MRLYGTRVAGHFNNASCLTGSSTLRRGGSTGNAVVRKDLRRMNHLGKRYTTPSGWLLMSARPRPCPFRPTSLDSTIDMNCGIGVCLRKLALLFQ